MNELVEQLVSVVAEEAEHCERLLTLLRQQQRHVIEGSTAELAVNVREQEDAIRHSRELETRRRELLERLAQLPQYGGEQPGLTQLVETVADEYGHRLEQLRCSLSEAIENVARTREQNALLIERSLFHIGETMRLLASAGLSGNYSDAPSGRAAAAGPVAVDRVG